MPLKLLSLLVHYFWKALVEEQKFGLVSVVKLSLDIDGQTLFGLLTSVLRLADISL